MNEFFKFLLNQEVLLNLLRNEWVKLYDYEYVDNKLIASLQANADRMQDLLNNITFKAQGVTGSTCESGMSGSTNGSTKPRKPIVPEPFNLTQPKPKKIQEPIKIEHKKFVTPIPYDEYNKISLQKLEEQRNNRIETAKEVKIF
jgi:hypothetical protein